jgi:PAS domain S-box-containing protein
MNTGVLKPSAWPRRLRSGLTAHRISLSTAIFLWIYSGVLLCWLLLRWWSRDFSPINSAALILPPQLLTAAMLAMLLAQQHTLERTRRIAWAILLAGILADMAAFVAWNSINESTRQPLGTVADLLYLLNYLAQCGCTAALFISCGGSFRRSRVWTDAAALIVGALAGLLPFLVTPVFAPAGGFKPSILGSLVYIIGIGSCGTMALLLFMHIVDWRREAATLVLVAGVLCGLAVDVASLSANVRGTFDLHNFDDLAYCLTYALMATAVALERRRQPGTVRTDTDGNLYSFLPVLCILLSIVIVLGAEAHASNVNVMAAAVLLLVGSALVIARQVTARLEVKRLNDALMSRQVEMRLTELVRQSGDLIVVLNSNGTVSYASPAAQRLLGRAADSLQGIRGDELLGTANQARLAALLTGSGAAMTDRTAPAEEFTLGDAQGQRRTVQVTVSNQRQNPLLGGMVLTVHDVTRQRGTERELLQAVNLERQLLSSELHEGLGQELTGVYLLAQNQRTAHQRRQEDLPQLIEQTITHVREAIDSTRRLARDCSPLQVARGSLESALRQLALNAAERLNIQVDVQADAIDATVPDATADHLYRIACEAITNGARHGHCRRALVRLQQARDQLQLSVTDDGSGFTTAVASDHPGLGLKMMDYRVRVMGGSLQFERPAGGGTRLSVTVPLTSAAA